MTNSGVLGNTWFKLAVVSLVGIILIFAVLWGINTFNGYYGYGSMNMGNGYHNGMQMQGGMNMGSMNMNGMNMNGGMQGGMGMHGMMGGMNMGGNMQGGMGMMGGMGMH
ncbi:hypothetical protein [Pseudobacteroides cellulosolvens]|uniref:Uncharacterized protein n=1 Tax=Pseudobacteroides cellulosolvens ATCC 35603 = DSM 2933 TaxID=398512 RepID=A0A0L6JQM7_9FIRM|nr:hypothetical protein [Pseudobacteroides cellulosolvens]KNY28088.1 hypothetical protein Bccel_3359 [Pseudobacteroides cellulosolvens ATCC 35603 = DSM 2933]